MNYNNTEHLNQLLTLQIQDTSEIFYINTVYTPQQLGELFCQQFSLDLANAKLITLKLLKIIESASHLPQYQYLSEYYERHCDRKCQSNIQFKQSYKLVEFFFDKPQLFDRNELFQRKTQQNIENIRQQQDQALSIHCTFNPQLNYSNNSQDFNRYQQLYQKGLLKQLERNKSKHIHVDKLDQLDDNCTFQPAINQNYKYQKIKNENLPSQLNLMIKTHLLKQNLYYYQLFQLLDSNNDGLISKDEIDISQLNQQEIKQPSYAIINEN
ncbi:unnamed protein product (macronuclear) [Paramecium tetraurelia]|uniref:EF-hand domain-containing protein n=1 Tax=Paramecium tetraurelia TaxID=5888 RepID=A0DYU9_PARTE|nr:uncharacterized protein GSPATT00003184001 [Paramecium tetraurelia]CAK88216.1 unnamed protein product [Paramecium tetraurelia]|eukprot:XP_001455613.1 hypothetical protein (macronuclear) [Paramecium tetraurelia strain d4-2]